MMVHQTGNKYKAMYDSSGKLVLIANTVTDDQHKKAAKHNSGGSSGYRVGAQTVHLSDENMWDIHNN
jgi:hypothetical protein